MTDYFYRFIDQDEMFSVFQPLGMTSTDDDGTMYIIQGTHQYALSEVGSIPGRGGWHVNLRVVDPTLDLSSVEPFRVYPDHPFCVWA